MGKIIQNLRSIKNQHLNSVKQLFRTTEKLIEDQVEITGLSTIDRAVRIMKSKTYVFADSVLCLGGALVLHKSKLGETN